MPKDTNYVPILKGLWGEFQSLGELKASASGITPMIDVPPLGWDPKREEPKKTVDEHVKSFADQANRFWNLDYPLFFDLYLIPPVEMDDGRHPLVYVFDRMRDGAFYRVKAIPVTGLGRPAEYQAAVRQVSEKDKRGICLRLDDRDFGNDDLWDEMDRLLGVVQVAPDETDLVIDLKVVLPHQVQSMTLSARGMLASLPRLQDWRSLTLAASGFPKSKRGASWRVYAIPAQRMANVA